MTVSEFLTYPVRLEPEAAGGYSVFVKVEGDELATQGETKEDALNMAKSLIIDNAGFVAGKEPIPKAGTPADGDELVTLPVDTALKFMLRNAMLEERWRISDLARKLGYTPQRLYRLIDFTNATKLDLLAPIFTAIGRPLHISC